MARHRNVRGYNYDDDFDDDDMYGQSVEDDYCISPATAAQFIYSKRGRHQSFSEPLEEEEDEYEDDDKFKASCTSLSSVDQARLYSCLDQMREVLGESVSEQTMIDAVLQCSFDVAKALDQVFKQDSNTSKKPVTQDAPSTERPGKEALFTSLQHLTNNQSLLLPNHTKCTDSSELGFNNPANRQPASNLSSSDSLAGRENIVPDFTPSLSLSALINESSQKNLGNEQPVALSTMSLLDLMNPSTAAFSTLNDLDPSAPMNCSNHLAQIPDLMQIGTSASVEGSKDMSISGLRGSQVISFPKKREPENHILREKATLFGSLSSVLQSEDSMSSDGENLSLPKYGSPSLADLIQEHKERNPSQNLMIDSPQKNLCNTDLQTGSGSNAAFDLPSLTTSLSSLAVSQSTDQRDFQVSLSDLIAETSNKPHDNLHNLFQSSGVTLNETNSNIDLRFLISEPLGGHSPLTLDVKPTALDHLELKPSSDRRLVSEKLLVSKHRKKSSHWVKSLKAKPSTFALSLCFAYIPKARRKSLLLSQLPGSQINELKLNNPMGHPDIVPFDFQTPSPDDIVKESQKKAFMR
ncbi:HBS1-like protein isoform X2 [Leptodactylus fuscus]|uniref:HBS1-like protein isoform X2 n=1 Tax=Leptodactylus fuscus TaxID=238119 RepID=UPI003F4E93B7